MTYRVVVAGSVVYQGRSLRLAEAHYGVVRGKRRHAKLISGSSVIREWLPGQLIAAYFGGDA